jgi:phage terminase Nu1 subunit (DNA packaging protein)
MDEDDDDLELLLQRDAALRERFELHEEQAQTTDLRAANAFDVVIAQLRAGTFPDVLRPELVETLASAPASLAAKVAEVRSLLT